MISIPIAPHIDGYKWQIELFWYNHKIIYGGDAYDKAYAVIIKRNRPQENKSISLSWDLDIPHQMCESYFDLMGVGLYYNIVQPLNAQTGLCQILSRFSDDQVIELLDPDMFHIRRHPVFDVGDDELLVDDFYESWHLKSLTSNRYIIEQYFLHGGAFYNGGFLPLIGRVSTFKRIMTDWIRVHLEILRQYDGDIGWWANMYALQAACERNKVKMVAKDVCYFPGVNSLKQEHYVVHYSCDEKFRKYDYPNIDVTKFPDDIFYNRLIRWLKSGVT